MKNAFRLDLKLAEHANFVEDHPLLQKFLQLVSHSCDSWYWLIGIVLLWLVGSQQAKYYALNLAAGLGLLAVFVLGLKFLIKRPRPEGEWGQIYRITDPHSFPSGHAARAVAIAIMASLMGSLPGWAVALIWIWAILVGYSRVALRLHYLSDVIAGWLVGLIGGFLTPFAIALFSRLFPAFYLWLIN